MQPKKVIKNVSANDLTKHVLKILDLKGFKAWRNNTTGVYDPTKKIFRRNPALLKGVPDVLGYHKKTALFICVEVKSGKDKLSQEQINFLNDVKLSGGLQFVIHNMDDIEEMNKVLVK